ncbi:MAG TPA: hypothetical protein VMZ74_02535 [Ramlibacter sp.]|nr:hypothetical protein [Ramlibacter sp.]
MKEGHRVVVMAIGFVGIRARPSGIVLALGFIAFFALKSRLEERLLLEEFGAANEDYRRRVPRLVPRVTRR